MTHYDPFIIQKFADKLYSRAASIHAVSVLVGLVAGGISGQILAGLVRSDSYALAIMIGALGAGLGHLIGTALGFNLKLHAQMALCQVQIEANTRRRTQEAQETQAA